MLDVACGSGRHVRWLAQQGFEVTALDRDATALQALRDVARICVADLEGAPWPLPGERFDAVVVTHYLWRALWPALLGSLAEGGVLIYETFAEGNETVGKPSRADFLLRHGELLDVARGLRIVAFEEGFVDAPPRFLQRIAAVAASAMRDAPARYPLSTGPVAGA